MGAGAAILGYALLSCGPLAAVAAPLVRRPLLLLLAFARYGHALLPPDTPSVHSAFYWLLWVVAICTLGRGARLVQPCRPTTLSPHTVLVPVASSTPKALLFLFLSGALQEYARWLLSRGHGYGQPL